MPTKIEELKEAFRFFDEDSDGEVNAQELADAMNLIGANVTIEDTAQIILYLDKNSNGTLDFAEFITLMEKKEAEQEEEKKDQEKQKKGGKTKNKLQKKSKRALKEELSFGPMHKEFEQQLRNMFSQTHNKDFLDYDEFSDFMKKFNKDLTELELYDMFKECDNNNDGVIGFEELAKVLIRDEIAHQMDS